MGPKKGLEISSPMTPAEIARVTRGGRQAEAAYAEAVVNGQIPTDEIRRVIGVDENGDSVYASPESHDN